MPGQQSNSTAIYYQPGQDQFCKQHLLLTLFFLNLQSPQTSVRERWRTVKWNIQPTNEMYKFWAITFLSFAFLFLDSVKKEENQNSHYFLLTREGRNVIHRYHWNIICILTPNFDCRLVSVSTQLMWLVKPRLMAEKYSYSIAEGHTWHLIASQWPYSESSGQCQDSNLYSIIVK